MDSHLTTENTEFVAARRGRIILAIYLDFVIFSVPWGLFDHFVLRDIEALAPLRGVSKFIVFSILEYLLHRTVDRSRGRWLLSIHRAGTPQSDSSLLVVPVRIKDRESWVTLLAGVVILLEGCKGVVRWTMWSPPVPAFGRPTDPAIWPMIAVAVGLLECFVAYLFFRLRRSALYVGAAVFGLSLVSTVQSWALWDSWAARSTVQRRAYQGVPVREGEIEQMQAMTPEILIAGVALYLALVLVGGVIIHLRTPRPAV